MLNLKRKFLTKITLADLLNLLIKQDQWNFFKKPGKEQETDSLLVIRSLSVIFLINYID